MYNVRSLRKILREMKCGESLYVNAINCSLAMINELRNAVKNNVLAPNEGEVAAMYNDVESVMCGDVILPQMTYTKVI